MKPTEESQQHRQDFETYPNQQKTRNKLGQTEKPKNQNKNKNQNQEYRLEKDVQNWTRKSKRRRTLGEIWEMNSLFSQSAWTAILKFTAFGRAPLPQRVRQGKDKARFVTIYMNGGSLTFFGSTPKDKDKGKHYLLYFIFYFLYLNH